MSLESGFANLYSTTKRNKVIAMMTLFYIKKKMANLANLILTLYLCIEQIKNYS